MTRGMATVTVSAVNNPSVSATCKVYVIGPDTYYGEEYFPANKEESGQQFMMTFGSSWSSGWYFPGTLNRINANILFKDGEDGEDGDTIERPDRNIGVRLIRKPK